MPQNYVLLERVELNNTASSVTFSNIPQTGYTDLKIVVSARNTSTGDYFAVSFNGSSASFSSRYLYWENTTANSGTLAQYGGRVNTSSTTASTFASTEVYIPNYAGSAYKSYSSDSVSENNAAAAPGSLIAGLWSNVAAITSITLTPNAGSFVANSTFSLYGIANSNTTPVVAPKASGGNVIATDGTYWYHAFLSNGTFTPQVALSADVLCIAGGGGGGYAGNGGAGGAGGVVYQTSRVLNTSSISVAVGAGGTSPNPTSGPGANGSSSTFDTITALGGGGGGGNNGNSANYAGRSGGSGGGGVGDPGSAGGSATQGSSGGGTGYGFAGGSGANNSFYTSGSGGGGGAGGAGGNATTIRGGDGGAGLNTWSSWASATGTGDSGYFASGGAGGGGGAGTSNGTIALGGGGGAGTSGRANTGGGGGGAYAGGSGIVIIRYAV